MFGRFVVRGVVWCWRHWVRVTLTAVALTVLFAWYALTTLGIDTDESKLLSNNLPFRVAEEALSKAFPEGADQFVVVIDAPTPGQSEQAADKLLARMQAQPDIFLLARRPAGTEFFRRQGLLYLSVDELQTLSDRLTEAQPMLGTLARDPSLRGILTALNLMLEGLARDQVGMDEIGPALTRIADAAEDVARGKPKPVAWSELMGNDSQLAEPRSFILSRPKLDYRELTPGAPAANAIRFAAADLGLTPENGYRVRLTGSVPLTDDNFATVTEGVELSTPLSVGAVVLILFAAVRSKRLVAIILATLVTGLAATAAFAAATVKTLNPISVAFAVMFVGIAVDFAIQFVARYRDARANKPTPEAAINAAAGTIVGPLALAAAATAVGFLSFLPTDYVGVSQLGLVAGAGMLIALAVDLTFLPALLHLARTPGTKEIVGMPLAGPIDHFIARHAKAIVIVAAILAVVGLAVLPWLRFDFNPLNLQNPKAEAVSTFRDIASNPNTSPYSIDILAPDINSARELAQKLDALPEVDHAASLLNLVPQRQEEKLALIADLNSIYAPVLDPGARLLAPTTQENVEAMERAAEKLRAMKGDRDGVGKRLADALDTVAKGGPSEVAKLSDSLLGGLPETLSMLSTVLEAKPITLGDLPDDLVREWRAADGRAKVSAWPKGNMNDDAALKAFVRAVETVTPSATGMPVAIVEAGGVVIHSFIQSGLTAVIAIGILLGLMLRRLLDAVLVVVPLILGGLYTVIGCVLMDLPINFANIIALPLLLGIGVAFNIYFVVNWRHGVMDHLQTSTGRAILFSALTTSSAFGSLAVSPHWGTASMGLLLFMSVGLSVATTFLVLPAIFHVLPRRTGE